MASLVWIRAATICCVGQLAFCAIVTAAPTTVGIAAASDLVFCLDDLNRQFTNAHPGVTLKTSTGSSGNFFAQIQNGAPFDVFLSADMNYPRDLIKAGFAEGSTLVQYATGRIVLWTVRTNLALTNGLLALTDPSVKRVAIANPAHAPYGRAARAALQHAGLWDSIQPRLVLGENISQAMQFVHTGNADAGIVALSLVMSAKSSHQGRYVEVPANTYPPLEQGAVLTRHGADNAAARDYLKFLQTAGAREIFDRHGFRLPRSREPAR
ncbi:MAG: molybdate transport system substrate-binding protein [Verrucomicrobiota bacterium]